MLRCLLLLLLLCCSCAPARPPQQQLPRCPVILPKARLVSDNWLQQGGIWRLRQAALLEIGPRRIPMEGFVRLDLERRQARLTALNEMGLVLFDLEVDLSGHSLKRALPQLPSQEQLATGVATSLRRIFLAPRAQVSDERTEQGLVRGEGELQLYFSYDCQGELRRTRVLSATQEWLVQYNSYEKIVAARLPQEIIYYDREHGVKLSLWLKEARPES